jgi:hypothetical protein
VIGSNYHEQDCKSCSGLHIKVHDLMVKWLINKLKNDGAELITAAKGNSGLPNKLKCDIVLTYHN